MSKWQPIETAPKDGSRILTLWTCHGLEQVEAIHWVDLTHTLVAFNALRGTGNAIDLTKIKNLYWAKDDGTEFPNAGWWVPFPEPSK